MYRGIEEQLILRSSRYTEEQCVQRNRGAVGTGIEEQWVLRNRGEVCTEK